MNRKIIIVLSEWGFWGEELIGPLEAFDAKGYSSVFCTPSGKRPRALPPSMDAEVIDPPLGKKVTSPEMAEKVRKIDDIRNKRLEDPLNLSALFPERPYWSEQEKIHGVTQVLRKWEAYYRERAKAQESLVQYDALLLVGGSGPMIDMVNNYRVHDIILGFLNQNKPIGAECYGVACLAQARSYEDSKSIIWGKHVTGHPKEYDYKDLTGVLDPETGKILARQSGNWVNFGTPFYTLEYMLRDAVGPDGQFHGNVGKETSVIVDYPFITGRSTADSTLTGQKMIEALDGQPPLKRWGW
jgi:putative intracellular protease/amidase